MKITRKQLRRIIQEELQRVSVYPPRYRIYSEPQDWKELQKRAEIPDTMDHRKMVHVVMDLRAKPENSWIRATFIVNNWGHIVVDATADQEVVKKAIFDSGATEVLEEAITDPQHKLYIFEVI